MALFAISDPHLSFATDKPMEVFGDHWKDHPRKIARHWKELVQDTDTVLVCGDISWSKRLDQARTDLEFLGDLPGQKILTKGNHDHWWSSTGKVNRVMPPTMRALLNDVVLIDDILIVAVRCWDYPGSPDYVAADDERSYQRELQRLKSTLKQIEPYSGKFKHLLAMLHYPPLYEVNGQRIGSEFKTALEAAGVTHCVHGHVHGPSLSMVVEGLVDGIMYRCVSVDHVDFTPQRIF